jgi:DNA repair protein RadC
MQSELFDLAQFPAADRRAGSCVSAWKITAVCETPIDAAARICERPTDIERLWRDVIPQHPLYSPDQEMFIVVCLDRKNRIRGWQMITLGTATSALVHPREVFRAAIIASACAILVSHNHPSGDPAPSAADLQVTRQLREAARCVDIELLDHVIHGTPAYDPSGRGYFSFRESGLL